MTHEGRARTVEPTTSLHWHRRASLVLGMLACLATALPPRTPRAEDTLTLAAAMSLRHVMPALTHAFRERKLGPEIRVNYGASGHLRRQVEGGAPIDAVVFADAASVDALIASRHADAATRHVIATNALVLIGAADAAPLTFATLPDIPEGELLSIGEPGAVPAGRYARTALRDLGVWDALQGRIVFGGHVGAVLNYARRGEVAAAIVYATETRGVANVKVLERASGPWAPTPEIVAAVTTHTTQQERSRAFVAFLQTPAARTILTAHGFGIP